MPPMYKSTGSQYLAFFLSKASRLFPGSAYLRKYQEEQTKVSMVSDSLLALPLHLGQDTFWKDSDKAKGDSPVGLKSTSSGSKTGRSFSGTGASPHLAQ